MTAERESMGRRPILFLDFDEVLVLGPYGGYDILGPAHPPDLWERLFRANAKSTLLQFMAEFNPAIVITTSWLRHFDRPGFEAIFSKTGLQIVANSLHEHWAAPQNYGSTRGQAILRWLREHGAGHRFVVLDDYESGPDLEGSDWHREGRVILCDLGVGLHQEHLPKMRAAMTLDGFQSLARS